MYAAVPRSCTCNLLGRSARAVYAALLTALVLLAGCGGEGGSAGSREVTLALDFTPNAVHAPIYAAARERLDRRHGIRLRIRPPGSAPDSLKLLAAGKADVAVLDIHDLGLARERGADVVGVGALVQRPLAAIIARAGIRRPRDLEGRRVGVSGLPSDPAVLRAVMEHDGGDVRRVKQVTIGFAAVPSLIEGRVDAVPAFWNAEGVVLRRRGVRIREFRVDDYGAPRYPEVVLFTTRRNLRREPRAIRAVVAAVADGVRAVLARPEAAIRDVARASGAEPGLVRAQLHAVAPAFLPPLRLDRRALDGWASWDARFGILRRRPDVERAFVLPPRR
jgi:NitT/TauT family transport system substrate-binding protein/putative hydroxymethylpyrimidine transport system substrate-binding protein